MVVESRMLHKQSLMDSTSVSGSVCSEVISIAARNLVCTQAISSNERMNGNFEFS